MSRALSCFTCGSLESETPFAERERGEVAQCLDCATEVLPSHWGGLRGPIITRARYRAAVQRRQKSGQLDWVDQVRVPA